MKARPLVCPVDGGHLVFTHAVGMHLCLTCAELLRPHELVKRATRRTRVEFARAHGHADDYRSSVRLTIA